LELLLRSIATGQDDTIRKVERLSGNVGSVEVSGAATLSQVPNVHNTVPPSGNNSVFIDEFNCEHTIIVTDVVPACRTQVNNHGFCICIDITVPSS